VLVIDMRSIAATRVTDTSGRAAAFQRLLHDDLERY
jgi:hypothetical protein